MGQTPPIFFNFHSMADDCPVCLEPLTGTVVHLGCCKKQVHIQCYVPKCPMCRAELPIPPNHPPQHVIVPIPVEIRPPPPRWKVIACCSGVAAAVTFILLPVVSHVPFSLN